MGRRARGRLSWGILAAVLAAGAGGCSHSHGPVRELRTPQQSKVFVAKVARGADPSRWRLVPGASREAIQAWADRNLVRELSGLLRSKGEAWTCTFAEEAGGTRSIGVFTRADKAAVTAVAERNGAPKDEIEAMLRYAGGLTEAELVEATTAVCE